MLPYVGPEIIAVLQAVCSFAPNDSRECHSPDFPKKRRQIHFVDGLVIQSELLQFEYCRCPRRLGPLAPMMRPRPV